MSEKLYTLSDYAVIKYGRPSVLVSKFTYEGKSYTATTGPPSTQITPGKLFLIAFSKENPNQADILLEFEVSQSIILSDSIWSEKPIWLKNQKDR